MSEGGVRLLEQQLLIMLSQGAAVLLPFRLGLVGQGRRAMGSSAMVRLLVGLVGSQREFRRGLCARLMLLLVGGLIGAGHEIGLEHGDFQHRVDLLTLRLLLVALSD